MNKPAAPTVSVIIPAYNAEKYIAECLQSIVTQPYPNIEVVVVNDGSMDRTKEIVEEFLSCDSRIKLVDIENQGVSVARNTGMEHSNGEFVMFVDADDCLLYGVLPHLLEIQQQYNADVVAAKAKTVFAGDNYDKSFIPAKTVELWEGSCALQNSLKDHPATYSVWAKLYNRKTIQGIRFPVGKRCHEDSFFLFQCFLKQVKMVVTDALVYKYTISPNSASRADFNEKFFDMMALLELKLKDIQTFYPELEELSYNLIVKTNMALLLNLCKSSGSSYKKAKRDAIQKVRTYRKYFIPASRNNKIFFTIIICGLYDAYGVFFRIKEKVKKH